MALHYIVVMRCDKCSAELSVWDEWENNPIHWGQLKPVAEQQGWVVSDAVRNPIDLCPACAALQKGEDDEPNR